jgi:glycosyltransferase involved in cell wall biosynthesis
MSTAPGAGNSLSIMIVAPPWLPVPPPAYGGTEAVAGQLARGLVERGHRVSMAAIAGSHVDGVDCIQTLDAPPECIGMAEPEWTHLLATCEAIEGVRPDVVIDHSGPLGAMLLADDQWPSLHVAHGRLDGMLGSAYDAVARRAPSARLIAISRSQRELAPALPFVGVCHNGMAVDDVPFGPAGSGYLLFVGRMTADKGPAAAIDIARATGRPLVIAAKCREPEERRYFDTAIAPRLGPGVRWLGEVDATRRFRLMAAADALLFPIDWPEPFGMVMIEAMACGAPVLATRRGAVPEVVRDGVTGFIRDSAADLEACVHDIHRLDRRACRRHVEENFSHHALAAGYERMAMAVLSA